MDKQLYTRKESTTYPGLFVKKYHRKVFFDNLWDAELVECRGHVEDAEGNIVVRPFTKIFNRHENGTDIYRDERCVAIRKVNGFMACVTYVPSVGQCVVSTTGSLDSDFVRYAKDMLPPEVFIHCASFKDRPVTFMFEIVHPLDPHVVTEEVGAYLIGMRDVCDEAPYSSTPVNEYVLDIAAIFMKVNRPEYFEGRFSEVVEAAAAAKHEGYVVYSESGKSLKIKSPFYLTTKFLGRLGKSKLEQMARNPLSFKQQIDEEFYPVLDQINLRKDEFLSLDEQGRMAFIRNILEKL